MSDDAVLFTDDPTKWDCFVEFWVSTQTSIKGRSKILELEKLQEQFILIIKHARSIQIHLGYLGSDIDSEGYSNPQIYRRLGIDGSIMAQLGNVWRHQSKERCIS